MPIQCWLKIKIADEIADDNIMLLDVVNMYLDAEDDEEVNDE